MMSCTVGEGLISLLMALRSIAECNGILYEVIAIFNLKSGITLEEELLKHLPLKYC